MRTARRFGTIAVAVFVIGAASACDAPAHHSASTVSTTAPRSTAPSTTAPATIPWSTLRNPILSYPDTAAKDVAVRLAGGRWHLFFSSVANAANGAVHWSIGTTSSSDLRDWSPLALWPDQRATEGLASPDIVRAPDGRYVVTYQSNPGDVGGAAKLYYRTSRDLAHWSDAKPLARALHPGADDRMIDAALAYVGTGVVLAYKYGLADGSERQAFEIAFSPSGSLDGPWTLVGRPSVSVFGDTLENYEFVRLDGRWHLVATSNTLDRPYLATLDGPPSDPQSWLHWIDGRVLNIPAEAWNSAPGLSGVTHEVANAIYLFDGRAIDGHEYVFYAGSPELTAFGTWGHAAIGIARSTDLVHWSVP